MINPQFHSAHDFFKSMAGVLEETGYQAGEMQSLGVMLADAGRLGTRVWFSWPKRPPRRWMATGTGPGGADLFGARAVGGHRRRRFDHAQHVAALVPALLRGKLRL